MVDFNNEKTISTPLADVLKILILEKRDYIMEALKKYHLDKKTFSKSRPGAFASGVIQLFYMLRPMLLQDLKEKDFQELEKQVFEEDIKEVNKAFITLENYLYRKNITRIDNKKTYDTTDTEAENTAKGL